MERAGLDLGMGLRHLAKKWQMMASETTRKVSLTD